MALPFALSPSSQTHRQTIEDEPATLQKKGRGMRPFGFDGVT